MWCKLDRLKELKFFLGKLNFFLDTWGHSVYHRNRRVTFWAKVGEIGLAPEIGFFDKLL